MNGIKLYLKTYSKITYLLFMIFLISCGSDPRIITAKEFSEVIKKEKDFKNEDRKETFSQKYPNSDQIKLVSYDDGTTFGYLTNGVLNHASLDKIEEVNGYPKKTKQYSVKFSETGIIDNETFYDSIGKKIEERNYFETGVNKNLTYYKLDLKNSPKAFYSKSYYKSGNLEKLHIDDKNKKRQSFSFSDDGFSLTYTIDNDSFLFFDGKGFEKVSRKLELSIKPYSYYGKIEEIYEISSSEDLITIIGEKSFDNRGYKGTYTFEIYPDGSGISYLLKNDKKVGRDKKLRKQKINIFEAIKNNKVLVKRELGFDFDVLKFNEFDVVTEKNSYIENAFMILNDGLTSRIKDNFPGYFKKFGTEKYNLKSYETYYIKDKNNLTKATLDGPFEEYNRDKILRKGTFKGTFSDYIPSLKDDNEYSNLGFPIKDLFIYKNGVINVKQYNVSEPKILRDYINFKWYYTKSGGIPHGPITQYKKDGTIDFQFSFGSGLKRKSEDDIYRSGGMARYSDDNLIINQGLSIYDNKYESELYMPHIIYNESNGNLIESGTKRNNKLDGKLFKYKDGNIIEEIFYLDGEVISFENTSYDTVKNSEGKIKTTIGFKKNDNGDKIYHGKVIQYYDNGEIAIESFMINGYLHSEFNIFYEDGTPKLTGFYRGGSPYGVWQSFYPNEKLHQIITVGYGDYSGFYKENYPSGNPKTFGNLCNGEKIGRWNIYSSDKSAAWFEEYKEIDCQSQSNFKSSKDQNAEINNLINDVSFKPWKDDLSKGSYLDDVVDYYKRKPKSLDNSLSKLYGIYTYNSKQEGMGLIDIRIGVSKGSSDYPEILVYAGYTNERGLEGHADGTIKDNILYESGVIKFGSIDPEGRWLKWGNYTLTK